MRILIPTTEFPPVPGGVATLAYEQAVGLAAVGAVARPVSPLPAATFEWRAAGGGAVARLGPLRALARGAVASFRPDFVHCPTYRGFGLPVALAAGRARVPFSMYLHGTEVVTETASMLRRLVMGYVLKRAAFVATNSENTRAMVLRAFPRLGDRVVAVPPGVHPEKFSDPATADRGAELRGRWLAAMAEEAAASDSAAAGASAGSAARPLPRGVRPVLALALCRMVKAKGIETVLRALAELLDRRPDVPVAFVAVGAGADLDAFKALAANLGLTGRVLFPGPVPHSAAAVPLKAADLYVQPSQPDGPFLESFGISFVEAQAAGLPCVGSRWGGVPEAVAEGETALLVPPGDVTALAAAIEMLATDKAMRAAFAEAAVARAARMSWKTHAESILGLIRTATKVGGRG